MNLPSLPETRELVMRYGRLAERLETELGERPLVLPNSRFFPDHFNGDLASFERLTERMAEHAGMSDIPIRVSIGGEEDASCGTGSCGSGACAPKASAGPLGVVDTGDHWLIQADPSELAHPIALTTRVARALAEIFLQETRAENESLEEPFGVTVDLTATLLGFGVLLLEGSYIYSKGCGGPQIVQLTDLPCPALSIAYACFVCGGEHGRRLALKELGATQRESVSAALDLVESNSALVAALRSHPEQLAVGAFELSETVPSLFRLFSKKSKSEPSLDDLEASLAGMPQAARKASKNPPDAKRDELRALVDEAFEGLNPAGE